MSKKIETPVESRPDQIVYKALPLVTENFRPKIQKKIADLLAELDSIREAGATAKVREDEIKDELTALQGELPGLRHGDLCFVSRTMPGRKSLDRGLLIENGVTPQTIEESMKEGKPFVERRFKNLAL